MWTFITLWVVVGLINGLYTVYIDWYTHDLFNASKAYRVAETIGMLAIGVAFGFVGAAITLYERFFDSSRI